jgi:hypothetical protein
MIEKDIKSQKSDENKEMSPGKIQIKKFNAL